MPTNPKPTLEERAQAIYEREFPNSSYKRLVKTAIDGGSFSAQLLNAVKDLAAMQSAQDAVDAAANNRHWQPIATAHDETWVEVCGDSNMLYPEYFIAVARKATRFKPLEPWEDVSQNCLSEQGWTPLFWRPLQPTPYNRKGT